MILGKRIKRYKHFLSDYLWRSRGSLPGHLDRGPGQITAEWRDLKLDFEAIVFSEIWVRIKPDTFGGVPTRRPAIC